MKLGPYELDSVVQGDCLELMKALPDKSIDLVLTDPPYGVGLEYASYQDTEENWFKLMAAFIPEAKRVGKMVIMPSCRIKALPWIYQTFPPDWLICWYKGSTGHAAYIGFNDWEPLLVYGKNNSHMHDYMNVKPTPFDNGHPCPKPIDWAMWLIKRATNGSGSIVLDPFMGSGTTCLAAKQLGMRWLGFELEQSYIEIAKKQLSQEVLSQWTLTN